MARKPAKKSKPVSGKKTRTGKTLDVDGKVAVPRITKDSETGKLRKTTDEEKKAARTTVLPKAGPEKVEGALPARRPVAGMGYSGPAKGFNGPYKLVKAGVDAARGHLKTMAEHPAGSPEHHAAHEAFNAIHAHIGQMSPELHTLLGQAKHFVTHPGEGSSDLLSMTHKAINDRLAIGRAAHEDNLRRSQEGRERKQGQ